MIRGAVMDMPFSLVDRLRDCAGRWVSAHGASLARLGRTVINDGGFFARIDAPGASVTTATLERFARFLGDPGNWPDGAVPDEVAAFVHVTGVSPPAAAPATGQSGAMSGAPHAAREKMA